MSIHGDVFDRYFKALIGLVWAFFILLGVCIIGVGAFFAYILWQAIK